MTTAALEFEPISPLVELLEGELKSLVQPDPYLGLDARHWELSLAGPLREFLRRPGKEFRARLVHIAWNLAEGRGTPPPSLPWIVELLHAGSLIIDDIEDGSAYRRGAPALHVLHGVPVALNAGNWLYFWALSLIARLELEPSTELALHRATSRALLDCHHGQALDLTLRIGALAQRDVALAVEHTTSLKTGSLLELAATFGAISAGADSERATEIARFGRTLGVALQMLDDLGGLTNSARAHKGHEDLLGGRPTWPWAWLAASQSEVVYARLQRTARDVERRDKHPEELSEMMRARLGPAPEKHVQRRLARGLLRLERKVGDCPALLELRAELERLEGSYG